jgi:hypothetical protein
MRKDDVTLELPGVVRRPGRPPTGKAMTSAQRKAASRARLRDEGKAQLNVNVGTDVLDAMRKSLEFKDEGQDAFVDRVLRAYLLRKR